MADNGTTFQTSALATPPAGLRPATRQLSLSGDTVDVQVIVPVAVTGSEGSWTAREYLIADDAAFTAGTNAVAMAGAFFNDSTPDSVDEGDGGALRMSARRELYVQIRDAAGNERGLNIDASGRLTVLMTSTTITGTVAVTQSGTWDEVGINDSGNSITVDNGGTFAVQVDGAALTALQLIDDSAVVLGTATYTEATSTGLAIGAVRRDADTTLVNTTNEWGPLQMDANGRLKVEAFSGETLPVSGTVTADLGATDNAVLDAIAASVAAIDTDATTIIGHVDGIEGLLTTIDGDTGNIVTSVQLLDDIVLAEDAAHQTGDKGVMALAVRQDAQADFGADGDYVPLSIDADGQLRVNAGVVTASAASEYVDDADWTDSTSTHTLVGGLYQSSPQTVTDGDVAPFNITANGAMHVAVQNSVVVDLGANNDVTVTGTVDLGATDNAVLDAIAASVAAIDTDATTIIGHVDGIEGLLTTIDADTGSILTAVQLIDDTVFAEDVAAQAADKGVAILAVRRDADTTLVDTTGDYANLQVDANGYLKVEIFDGGGSHTVDNNGTFAVQVDGSALTALQVIDNPVLVDDAAFTPATSSVMMAGFEADEGSTDSVDEGDAGAARMTLDRKQIATLYPHTAGGLTVAQLNGADGGGGVLVATAQVIKASAGQLYGYYCYNPNSSATFVHFYNTAAASVTVGTTNPLISITIPATSAANLTFPYGVAFSNAGWSAAATTTAGGNTAPSTGLDLTVFYN